MNEPEIVNIHEAKTHLSKLLERAHSGEEIIRPRPVSRTRLMPLAPKRRRGGQVPGLVIGPEFFEPLPEEELRAWEGR